MLVKPIESAKSFQVNSSTETADEGRRDDRERSKRGDKKSKQKSFAKNLSRETNQVSEENTKNVLYAVDPALACQIVDSEKVIDLLAHKPAELRSAQKAFSQTKAKPPSDNVLPKPLGLNKIL